jgi:PAS domain S-box-containing protein
MNALPAGLPEDFAARLVVGAADAIIYADAQGRMRFWNAAATRIFGFAESEAIGESLDLIVPERLRPPSLAGL